MTPPARYRTATLLISIALLTGCSSTKKQPDLQSGFVNPPNIARTRTWWHWVSGNVSQEGITADLEAMKRVGVGGAQCFSVDQGPKGKVLYMSKEWRDLTRHAISEAARLNLELTIHNCEGWSESGGKWITPDLSMQKVVWSEQRVHGPMKFDDSLPQPQTIRDYYRDIAVFAFLSLPGEQATLAELKPKITSSDPTIDGAALIDGDPKTTATIKPAATSQPAYVQLELAKPLRCGSFSISPVGASVKGELQVSDDGKTFRTIATFAAQKRAKPQVSLVFDEVSSRFFRIHVAKLPDNKPLAIADISFAATRIPDFRGKTAMEARVLGDPPPAEHLANDVVIHRDALRDITQQMDAAGHLTWDVPEGDWTLLRIGATSTGKLTAPAMPETAGLECDKMSRRAVEAHFNGMLAKIIADSGEHVTDGLKMVLMDSWEAGCQNWTPAFREEFQSRRGYDPLPWMAAMTGRYVESADATERFLWDYRRTIADLIAENHYGLFATLLHERGIQLTAEAVGIGMPTIADQLQCKGRTDVPMGEFWVGASDDAADPKEASSAAHIYGKTIAATESFTSVPEQAGWRNDPFSLKIQGDRQFCNGVNRFVFHRYAHQPWLDRAPGMTMGPWGINFERTNTWWEPGAAWLSYLSRCQYMLQRGLFVADICYLYGEDAPRNLDPHALQPPPPKGYDYDACNAEVLLTRMRVADGRLVLPDGMSYRVLVLPQRQRMTPALLTRIQELVEDGATVIGPRPTASPSLADFPGCDDEVKQLAEALWANCDGKRVTEHAFGKGRIIWGQSLEQVLASIAPDFEPAADNPELRYIHRRDGNADIYFISNQRTRAALADCTFRITGKIPELWHPDTGTIEPAPVYSMKDGRTTVSLRFDPAGSVFVVFRQPFAKTDPIASVVHDGERLMGSGAAAQVSQAKLEIRKAVYGVLTGPESQQIDITDTLAKAVKNGALSVKADNKLSGKDPAPNVKKQLRVEYTLDSNPASAVVDENAQLEIPEIMMSDPPPAELEVNPDGVTHLIAWEPGTYQLTTAAGKIDIKDVDPPPRTIQLGTWSVVFPSRSGETDEVTFDRLISWTESPDDAIKYFSGTATYSNDFEFPDGLLEKDLRFHLDLGNVKNLARVKLNGKDLGVLWKPPFRIDIGSALRPGHNHLEVELTNLWPNRLIGDQRLPENERTTWTTFNPYKKDSPLLESGLLGPCMIRVARVVEVSFEN